MRQRLAVPAFTILAALALLSVPARAAAWGDGVRGNGKKTTVVRELPPFDAVQLEGGLDLVVKVGGAQSVATVIDENLQGELDLHVDGHTLVIDTRRGLHWSGEGRAVITVPAFSSLAIRGSGDAKVEGGSGDVRVAISGSGDVTWTGEAFGAVDVSVSGSGDVRLAGKAERLKVRVSGSGDVNANDLVTRDAEVSVAGSGDVRVRLSGGKLSAAIAGSGDITWSGECSLERAAVSGSGSIRRG